MRTEEMKDKAREFGKQTQEKAGHAAEQAREQATALAGQAQEKIKKTLDEQKNRGVGELSSLAQAVRHTSQQLRDQKHEGMAQYVDRTAEQMDRMIHYFESRDVGELVEEAETFARRHPEAFLGGAFVLGMVAGRFMKSSKNRSRKESVSRWDEPASTTSTGQTPFPTQTSSPTPTAY
jgi:ElaB/YqjD/DUF883 family membrane-anchored ribosome-binding protein